jgi:hypothetical protein
MGLGTFVVLPPLLCTALRPFRSVPLSAQGSGGGHGEGTRDELVTFPPVSLAPAAPLAIICVDSLALRDLEASGAYRIQQSDVLYALHMTGRRGTVPHSPSDGRTRGGHKA